MPERRNPDVPTRRTGDEFNVTRGEHESLKGLIARWVTRSVWTARGVVFLICAVGVLSYLAINANSDRIDQIDANTDTLEAQADAIAHQADEIAGSRRAGIVLACRETNRRHRRSLAALDGLMRQAIHRQPERAAEIRRSTRQFAVFVNALVPDRDCQNYANRLTAPPAPTKPGPPPP